MSGKLKNAEEYNAAMERMVQGIRSQATTTESTKHRMILIWTSIFVLGTAFVLWLVTVVEGGSQFVGKGIFW